MNENPKLTVEDALEGWGDPSQRAAVLAAEVAKQRAIIFALREYYDAVHSAPVNYSCGNSDRVMTAISNVKKLMPNDRTATPENQKPL